MPARKKATSKQGASAELPALQGRILQGEITLSDHVHEAVDSLRELDREYAMMTAISEELARSQAKALDAEKRKLGKDILRARPLLGLCVSFKDAICVRGVQSAAGSKALKGYTPVFDATVVSRLREAGCIVLGKTAQDEFGFGSFSVNVGKDFRIPRNPLDRERCCGGSSGGAAALAAAAPFPHVAIAESTGGSIAAPAAFCGVHGLCPTYGLVSRNGLIDYANSLDKIGPIARSLDDVSRVLDVIAGFDAADATSLQRTMAPEAMPKSIALVKQEGVAEEVASAMWDAVKRMESAGVSYKEVSLPYTAKFALAAYYIIATSEASTNLARYCGLRYGFQPPVEGSAEEHFTVTRGEAFGAEAKRRILLGTYARMAGYRSAYYERALAVRSRIIAEYQGVLKRFGALVSPAMPLFPPRFDELSQLTPLQHYAMDHLLVGPNLAGLPHLSIPLQARLPAGLLLIGNHLQEKTLIRLGRMA